MRKKLQFTPNPKYITFYHLQQKLFINHMHFPNLPHSPHNNAYQKILLMDSRFFFTNFSPFNFSDQFPINKCYYPQTLKLQTFHLDSKLILHSNSISNLKIRNIIDFYGILRIFKSFYKTKEILVIFSKFHII